MVVFFNYFTFGMHFTGILGCIINFYTFYAIIFLSPKSMKAYQYHILWYQIWSFLIDLLFHGGVLEIYPTINAAKMLGPLYTVFHFDLLILWDFGTICINNMCLATAQCFLYNHWAILPSGHWLKISREKWLLIGAAHYIFYSLLEILVSSTVTVKRGPEVSNELETRIKENPYYSFTANDPDVWLADASHSIYPPFISLTPKPATAILVFLMSVELMSTAVIFIGHSVYLLQARSDLMSTRTKKHHKKLLMSLSFQTLLPLATITGPWTMYATLLVTGISAPQVLVNISMILNGLHAALSSIMILVFTTPYREALLSIFRRTFSRRLE